MAEKDTITTKFKVDISDLKKGITEANDQIKLVNSEFKKASAGMDDWAKSSDGIKAKLDQLKSVLDAQNKKLEAYQKQLEAAKKYEKEAADNVTALKQALEKAKSEYGENSDEVKKLSVQLTSAEKAEAEMKREVQNLTVQCNNQEAAVKNTASQMNKLEDELDDVEAAEKQAAKTGQSLDDALDDVKKSAEDTSGGFTVMKGALASLVADGIQRAIGALKDFVVQSINVGKKFDASMSQVAAISGATGSELEALREKAKEMGANTKFSASEAADAFNYMAMAGWKTEDMLSGIDGILALAAASGTDLATTSDIVTDALTGLGYGAGDAGRLADVLAAASANANTNVEMMGGTFKYAAPIAGALGYSMEDVAIASGLMANSGIKAEQAGTSLRSIFTRLATDAGRTKNQLGALGVLTDELGVQFYNVDGTTRDLLSVILDAREAWKGLSEEEQTLYAKQIAGQEAMSGWLAIMNAAPSDVGKLTNAIYNSNGAAEEMARIMQDNLQGDLVQLGSKLEGVQIAMYEKFEPAMRKGVEVLSKLLDVVNWVVENSTYFIAGLKGMGTAIGAYLAYTTAIKVMKEGWMSLEIAQKAVTAAQWLMNTAMSANPIGAVIAVVAGLVAVFVTLWNKSEAFREFWLGLWEQIKTVCEPAVSAIKTLFEGLWTRIQEIFSPLTTYLAEKFAEPIAKIKEVWGVVADWFSTIVIEPIKSLFTGNKDVISSSFTAAWDKIKEVWATVQPFFEQLWEGINASLQPVKDAMSNAFNEAWKLIETVWGEAPAWFQSIWEAIKIIWDAVEPYFKTLWEAIKVVFSVVEEVIGAYFRAAWEAIKIVWSVAVDFFASVWDSIASIFSVVGAVLTGNWQEAWDGIKAIGETWADFFIGVWEAIKDVFSVVATYFVEVFTAAWDGIKAIWNLVQPYFEQLWESIKSVWNVVSSWFVNLFTNAWNGIKEILSTWKEFFVGIWESVKEAFSGVPAFFKNVFTNAWNNVKNAFSKFKSFFSDLWNSIENTFSGLGTKIGDAIGGAVKSAINGVISQVESIINNAIGLINGAIGLINKIPGVSVGTVGKVSFPRLAKGGVLDKGARAVIAGEAGAEAVVPLERNKYWISKVADEMMKQLKGSSGSAINNLTNNNTNNFTQIINAPKQPSRIELYRQTKNLLELKGAY